MATDDKGKVKTSISKIKPDQNLWLQFYDGRAQVKVKQIVKENTDAGNK
jgi:exonuclease VII large subunit